nr:hypothetical protein [uncultured Roseateles sp.]
MNRLPYSHPAPQPLPAGSRTESGTARRPSLGVGQRSSEDLFVPMPPLNAGTFAAAVAVTSFLAMVTVLA